MNWSASLWWTQHLRSLANMSGENSVPKMSARVNVTSESDLLPLWSDCPPRPSSTGAEPTMLQATWREQAHRARTPLRLTCFAAALAGHPDPFHANVSRVDGDIPFGPKTRTSCTSSSASAEDTHELNRHRLFFMLIRNVIWSANLSRTQNLRMSANMSGGEKCPNGNCRCECDWCE